MVDKPIGVARRELDLVKKAQETIRRAFHTLEDETGKSIDSVRVDTRNFANLGHPLVGRYPSERF